MFDASLNLIAATILIALTCSGNRLMEDSPKPPGQRAPIRPGPHAAAPDKNIRAKDVKTPIQNSAFGLVHDFGKIPCGTLAKHVFRIINTSNNSLRIVSLRIS